MKLVRFSQNGQSPNSAPSGDRIADLRRVWPHARQARRAGAAIAAPLPDSTREFLEGARQPGRGRFHHGMGDRPRSAARLHRPSRTRASSSASSQLPRPRRGGGSRSQGAAIFRSGTPPFSIRRADSASRGSKQLDWKWSSRRHRRTRASCRASARSTTSRLHERQRRERRDFQFITSQWPRARSATRWRRWAVHRGPDGDSDPTSSS